jgi:hypothetical protein
MFSICFFCIFLTVPIVMLAFPAKNFFKIDEYRKLSEFPDGKILWTPQWSKEFSNWFNDHFFFRNPLVCLAGSFYYYLFNYSDQLYFAKNGYMYYRNVMDNELFVNHKAYEAQKMGKFSEYLKEMKTRLNKKNIKLVVVVCPQKYLFYPEIFDQPVPNVNTSYFKEISDSFKKIDGLIAIDVLDTLINAKNRGLQIFHVTDFHWTDPAGYFVGQNILQKIASDKHVQVSTSPLEIEPLLDFVGGQSRSLPLFYPIRETTIGVKKNWDDRMLVRTQINTYPYEWVSENCQGELPPVAFLGNSFGDAFIRSGFNLSFSKFYKFNRGMSLSEAVSLVPDDVEYFIWQIIEVQLGRIP